MEVRKNINCLESEQKHLHCCFKVIDKQITLAELRLYVNPYHKINGLQAIAFGHFQCANDPRVFQLLMDAAVEEVQKLGHRLLIGPLNGSTWNDYRVVTSYQKPPFYLDIHTPDYHIELMRHYGFTELAAYHSSYAEEIIDHWDEVEKSHQSFVNKGVIFEGFNLDDPSAEFEDLYYLCSEAFAENFLYSPISEVDFQRKMNASLPLIEKRYTIMARKDGKLVGFIFCYKDLWDKTSETIVVKTLARSTDKEFQGIGSALSALAMKHAKVDGFTKGIHALMVNSNTSTYISTKFKANPMRNYALMCLKID
ncbi:GNAT family N-acetyltransferase [Portibacter marinus]|uniref:GNAT family N-acetyltransferase n=1 Tax=Portibacter marinus TaxID=2898660 RepID=UPI001F2CE951|nr:GNAT family N-acetyltransferase [Portibacter marinus]